MRSHLYCGIATSLGVIKRKGKASKQELDAIDKALRKLFDFTLYDIVRMDGFIYLTIKKDILNDNINNLRIELGKNLYLSGFLLYNNECLRENCRKEEIAITLKDDSEEEKDGSSFFCSDLYYSDFSSILRRDIDSFKDYYFIIKVKPLFIHDDKIICKNKMEIMCLLNWFKKDYFKSRLNGSIIFYIR